jgi:CMP-N-acetylneuraminic acid synthetase
MRVLALIPARGDSKAIPKKNVRPLLGKSLVERAFDCATAAGVLDRIILSTDSDEIAALGRGIGLEVPFLRPAEFARDESPMIDVVLHALRVLGEGGYRPDAVMILQPTSPLRRPAHIRDAVALLLANPAADAVCSVFPVPKEMCPHYLMKITDEGYVDFFMPDGGRYTRRQDVPQAWRRDGTIFLTRVPVLTEQRSFYGRRCLPVVLDANDIVNIDSPEDWLEAERLLGARASA